jgi:hypothetical protein
MNEFKQKIHIEEHIKQTLIATDEIIGIFQTKLKPGTPSLSSWDLLNILVKD